MPKRPKPTIFHDHLAVPGPGIRVDSAEWFGWLRARSNSNFIYEGQDGRYSARREERGGKIYWYAYRRRGGRLAKAYLGKSEELTQGRLAQVGAQLAGGNLLKRLETEPGPPNGTVSNVEADLSFFSLSKVRAPAMPQRLVRRPRLTQRISSAITL